VDDPDAPLDEDELLALQAPLTQEYPAGQSFGSAGSHGPPVDEPLLPLELVLDDDDDDDDELGLVPAVQFPFGAPLQYSPGPQSSSSLHFAPTGAAEMSHLPLSQTRPVWQSLSVWQFVPIVPCEVVDVGAAQTKFVQTCGFGQSEFVLHACVFTLPLLPPGVPDGAGCVPDRSVCVGAVDAAHAMATPENATTTRITEWAFFMETISSSSGRSHCHGRARCATANSRRIRAPEVARSQIGPAAGPANRGNVRDRTR
jgi:hypothetical protein